MKSSSDRPSAFSAAFAGTAFFAGAFFLAADFFEGVLAHYVGLLDLALGRSRVVIIGFLGFSALSPSPQVYDITQTLPDVIADRCPTCGALASPPVEGDGPFSEQGANVALQGLREHYPGMVAHLESVLPVLSPTGLWDVGFQFGDWLDPDAPADQPAAAKAALEALATTARKVAARR